MYHYQLCDSAIITITAADPDGLQANQGFSVAVGQDGVKPATIAIFGLRDPGDRSTTVDPTNVAGRLSVLLDVQSNDETVVAVALTLNDTVIPCRGASSDATPIGVAEAGGQIEVECLLSTDKVMEGECTGYPLAPMFMNGEYALGAHLTTAEGTTREVFATQTLTLKNKNYLESDFNPGQPVIIDTETTAGVEVWYGGPTTDENLNSIDVCPVLFDDDIEIGTIIVGDDNTSRAFGALSLTAPPAGNPTRFAGVPVSKPEPYTWEIRAEWNLFAETSPNGTRFRARGILDPNGVDITGRFSPYDEEGRNAIVYAGAQGGAIRFDFKPPLPEQVRSVVLNTPNTTQSQIAIGYWTGSSYRYEPIVAGRHYSDIRGGRAQIFATSRVWENGTGFAGEVIAAGDCSIKANTDTGADGTATPFQAIADDVDAIPDLLEEDPTSGEFGNEGAECYVVELQSMMDLFGNDARPYLEAYGARVQGAASFGVDRTPPAITDQRPDEPLVIRDAVDPADAAATIPPVLTFSTRDPALASGDPGSGVIEDSIRVYTGEWSLTARFPTPTTATRPWGNYVSRTNSARPSTLPSAERRYGSVNGDEVTVYLDGLDESKQHTVKIAVPDNAWPKNFATTSFTFARDNEAPAWNLGSGTTAAGTTIEAGTAQSVGLIVKGKITDYSVIDKAVFTVRDASGGTCDTTATALTTTDVASTTDLNERRLRVNGFGIDNGTKSIEVDLSLTLMREAATGTDTICFTIETEDSAVTSDGRGPGNTALIAVGNITVNWTAGS